MKEIIILKLNVNSLGIQEKETIFENEEVMWQCLKKLAEYDELNLPGDSEMVRDNLQVPAWKYVLLNTYSYRSAGTFYTSEGKFVKGNYTGVYDNVDEFVKHCEEKAKTNIQKKLTTFEKNFLTDLVKSSIDNSKFE